MFGGFFFGQQFFGEVQIVETVTPSATPSSASGRRKGSGPPADGGRFKTREEAWRDQEALAIAADDEELLRLVPMIIQEITSR